MMREINNFEDIERMSSIVKELQHDRNKYSFEQI